MPAIVDHDERRQDIANAVERLVLKSGMQSVTVRAVGQEAGFSAAIVGHYFNNKEDLLTFTYLSARYRSKARLQQALDRGDNLFDCLKVILPTDTQRKMEWKIWFGFWGIVTNNPKFSDECHTGLQEANALFQQALKHAVKRGELPKATDCALHAMRLSFVINGIASVVLQTPEVWPARTQEKALQAEIDMIKNCG